MKRISRRFVFNVAITYFFDRSLSGGKEELIKFKHDIGDIGISMEEQYFLQAAWHLSRDARRVFSLRCGGASLHGSRKRENLIQESSVTVPSVIFNAVIVTRVCGNEIIGSESRAFSQVVRFANTVLT